MSLLERHAVAIDPQGYPRFPVGPGLTVNACIFVAAKWTAGFVRSTQLSCH
ncbi:hypothetical protein PQR67_27480 [Paraburkholderia fungorum]|uniref:hypothetical protein n=1 Tax=Paraburkholderia fungorum TaxID=134537 RepID=UPI0038B848D0